jgi:hypothetical protein
VNISARPSVLHHGRGIDKPEDGRTDPSESVPLTELTTPTKVLPPSEFTPPTEVAPPTELTSSIEVTSSTELTTPMEATLPPEATPPSKLTAPVDRTETEQPPESANARSLDSQPEATTLSNETPIDAKSEEAGDFVKKVVNSVAVVQFDERPDTSAVPSKLPRVPIDLPTLTRYRGA